MSSATWLHMTRSLSCRYVRATIRCAINFFVRHGRRQTPFVTVCMYYRLLTSHLRAGLSQNIPRNATWVVSTYGEIVFSTRDCVRRFASHASRPAKRPRTRVNDSMLDTGLVVTAVGRVNVGKSTLFNRLARAGIYVQDVESRRVPFVPSIVDPLPGVTRDSRQARAALMNLQFNFVDTAGLEDAPHPSHFARFSKDSSLTSSSDLKEALRVPSLLTAQSLDPDLQYRRIYRKMSLATIEAVNAADVLFFVMDASVGVTPLDRDLASWVREKSKCKNIILIANKCDTSDAEMGTYDALQLGFGEPIAISAEHNIGFGDLYWAMRYMYEASEKRPSERSTTSDSSRPAANDATSEGDAAVSAARSIKSHDDVTKVETEKKATCEMKQIENAAVDRLLDPEFEEDEPIKQLIVSIIGRPNVGKSTLLNKLLKREHSLTGPVSGVTRDAVLAEWCPTVDGDRVWFVDTAGIRPKPSVSSLRIESLSVKSSFRALRLSHVVVLVLDANVGLTKQDVKLVQVAITEGRAIVIVLNKMDCIERSHRREFVDNFREGIKHSLDLILGVEVIEMCAVKWDSDPSHGSRLYHAIQRARTRWERRVPTSALTGFVKRFNNLRSVGMGSAKRVTSPVVKFISQKKTRPPTFRLDGSSAASDEYIKALTNALRREFGFEGVPIRIKRPAPRHRR